MQKAKIEVIKKVIQQSRLTNKMVAEAFGYDSVDNLNVEFLDTFGETVTEFRERCKANQSENEPPLQEKNG